MLGLYVHIPFCQAICGYCTFNRGLFDRDLKDRYLRALDREIRQAADGRPVDTVFFGGGTPSLLEPSEVNDILRACRDGFRVTGDVEVTLETNPESVAPGRLEGFLEAGVTRFSFGVQSFHGPELARLDRQHSAATAAGALTAARAAGADNVSLDLMFWLPGQTLASWRASVERAVDLAPAHLSLYLLEVYPHAPLADALRSGTDGWTQVSDDDAADMYLAALDQLEAAGYEHYEISNVARPGFASRHNLKYWTMGEWYGFGCGAHSTVAGTRWHNLASTVEYIRRLSEGREVAAGREVLTAGERAVEAVFTGLRLVRGVDGAAVKERFGRDPFEEQSDRIAELVAGDLAWQAGRRIGLTRRGMLVSNEILAAFV